MTVCTYVILGAFATSTPLHLGVSGRLVAIGANLDDIVDIIVILGIRLAIFLRYDTL